jgi:hypothetical protein
MDFSLYKRFDSSGRIINIHILYYEARFKSNEQMYSNRKI